MTTITATGELLTAAVDDRTLTYLLLPFGEPGRTNLGLVTASAGAVTVPDNVADVTLNMEHDHKRPIGRATSITEDTRGLTATFRIATTSAGDDLLVEAAEGLRTGVSVELANASIRRGALIAGELHDAAAVVRPAFPSALLVAADAGDLPEGFPDYLQPSESTSESSEEVVIDGVTYVVKRTSTSKTEVSSKTADPTDPPADAEDTTTQEDTTVTASKVSASAPADLTANRTTATNRGPVVQNAADLGRLLAAYHQTQDRDLLAALRTPELAGAGELFAALTDIKWDGAGGLSQTITQPQWLGNIWNDREFQRKIIPLLGHGDLTSLNLKGWKWGTKPVVAAWSGNKTAVPSGTITADPVTGTATRYAGAHDIAREFRDFGNAEFWEAYIKAMTESYAEVTDLATGTAIIDAATDVVAGTVPTDVPAALAYIVDGALSMLEDVVPTFALVAPDLWRGLVLTPTDHALEFLSAALSLEDGTFNSFKILPYTGLAAGTTLVGAKSAATVYELPGSPIRVEAENLANGGIDDGFFGYHGVVINEASALALVAPDEG